MAARHPSARRLLALCRALPPRLQHSRPRCLEGPWAAETPPGSGAEPPGAVPTCPEPLCGEGCGCHPQLPIRGRAGEGRGAQTQHPHVSFSPHLLCKSPPGQGGCIGAGRLIPFSPKRRDKVGATELLLKTTAPGGRTVTALPPGAPPSCLRVPSASQAREGFLGARRCPRASWGRAGLPQGPRPPEPSLLPMIPPRCSARDAAPGASGARRAAA